MMNSECEVTRKRLRTPICDCDQSHAQFDLRVCERVLVQPDALTEKACRIGNVWNSVDEVSLIRFQLNG